MEVKIYCLYEPHTCKIRYIGRTKSLLKRRLSQHISKAKNNYSNSHKENWIRKLLKNGIRPKIKLLKIIKCSWEESHVFEKKIIQKHFLKHSLVNGDDRGPGNFAKNVDSKVEEERRMKLKEHYSKEKNKSQFYNELYCYDSNGDFYKKYKSAIFASKELNINAAKISRMMYAFDNKKMKVNPVNGYYFSKFKHVKYPISDRYNSKQIKMKVENSETCIIFESIAKFAKHFNLGHWDLSQYRKGIKTKRFKQLETTFVISPL